MYLAEFETIIWDWNGTLLDDSWLGVEIMNNMLKSRSMEGLSIDRYREIFDFPVKDYYALLGFNFTLEPFEVVGNEFIENYNKRRYECKLRTGAFEILQENKQNGRKQFVLSARNHNHLEEEFDYYQISSYFEHFSGLTNNWASGKTEQGLEMIRSQKINTTKTVLIGDTLHDHEVAEALGVKCILVEGGHQSAERIKNHKTLVIKNLTELLKPF